MKDISIVKNFQEDLVSENIKFSDDNFTAVNVKEAIKENKTNIDAASSKANAALSKAEQAFQSASDGKQKIATAITGKGIEAGGEETFDSLASKITSIEQSKGPASLKDYGILTSLPAKIFNTTLAQKAFYCDCGNGKVIFFEGTRLYEYDLNDFSKRYINTLNATPSTNCIYLDGIIYYVSGVNFMAYNTKTNKLVTKSNADGKLAYLTIYHNTIYSIGGEDSFGQGKATFIKYNVAEDTWDQTVPQMLASFNNSSTAFEYNDKLYVIGQYKHGQNANILIYDDSTNAWLKKDNTVGGVYFAFVKDTYAYLFYQSSAIKYNLETDKNENMGVGGAPLLYPTVQGKANPIYFNNKIYYFGTVASSNSTGNIKSILGYFDIEKEYFCVVSDTYPFTYRFPGVCCNDTDMYLNGNGYNKSNENFAGTVKLWHYNFKNSSWRQITPSQTSPLYGKNKQGFIALYNDKVYFGFEKNSSSITGSGKSDLYYYDPSNETIVEVKKDIEARIQYDNSIIFNDCIYSFGYKSLCIYNLTNNIYTNYPTDFELGSIPYVYNNSIYVFNNYRSLYKLNNDNSFTSIPGDFTLSSAVKRVFNIKDKYYIAGSGQIFNYDPENAAIINIVAEYKIDGSYCSNTDYFYIVGDEDSRTSEGAPGMKIYMP